MLNRELIHKVELLSITDRVALIEYLARSVRKELEDAPSHAKKDEPEEPRLLTDDEKQALA
jgi:hypothetical protein